MVPYGIHGDDAGVQGQEAMLVVTWNSVATELSTIDSRMLFGILKLSEKVKDDQDSTMQMFYSVLQWSLDALSKGRFPTHDHLGRPFSAVHDPARFLLSQKRALASGFVGAWAEMRGALRRAARPRRAQDLGAASVQPALSFRGSR